MTTIGFKNRELLFVSAVLILLSSYAAAAVSTGNDINLSAGACFDFSIGNVTLNISNCDLSFTGNCTQNNQGCMNPWTLHANASGKIKGIGPGVNISNVWKVSEMNGSMSMYNPSFPLYMATDGLSIVTFEGNYGAFVVDNISADSSYIIFDYRYQDNGSNVLGEMPASGCPSYGQQECFNAQQQGMNCFWEGSAQVCMEQSSPGPGGPGGAGCWSFDFNENSCRSVMGCTYCNATNVNSSGNPCYGMGIGLCQGGGPNQQIACQNITDQNMCNKIPMLSTCCQWVNSTCQELTTNNSCHNIMPPQGKNFCNDWNVTTKADCDEIASMPYFMPCTWDNVSNKCGFRQDKMFDGGGNFGDIQSQSNCEAAGGKWRVEFYTVIDQYGEKSVKDEWCEMGTGPGQQICDNDCWACEYKPGQAGSPSGRWENVSAATAACEGSALGFCYWEQDPNNISMSKQDGGAPGWCFPLQQMNFGGGNCDMNCFDCFAETPAKAKDRCDNSKAGCKWFWDSQQNTSGWCDRNNVKSCAEDCFMCYDSSSCTQTGLGGNNNCAWRDNFCQPSRGGGEICFNGVDDDSDQQVDCGDSDCTYDPFCGGNSGNDCGKFNSNNNTCANTPGCAWIQDKFCDTCHFCGREEELCFSAQGNQTLCSQRNDTCRWISQQNCDVNQSLAQTCFGAGDNESACNLLGGLCTWKANEGGPNCTSILNQSNCNIPGCYWNWNESVCKSGMPAGFCDFKMFGCNQYMNNDSCTTNSNGSCAWMWSPQGGNCAPICASKGPEDDCLATPGCAPQAGFCEPKKFAKMDDCPMHMNESSCSEYNQTCAWVPAPGGASCDVNKALGKDVCGAVMENQSMNENQKQIACANINGCAWIVGGDQGGPGPGMGGAFCGPKVVQCFMNQTRQQNMQSCEAPAGNETLCKWVFNHCEPRCMGLDTTACGTDPQCMVVSGFCNPKMMNDMFGNMEGGPPVEIARDPCGPGSGINSSQSDICLMGIKDSPASFGFGLGVSNIYSAAICQEFNPGASKTTKFYWYLDTDGNGTNNCNASDSSTSNQTGFEFFFKYEGQMLNNNLSEIRVAYKCVSGDWAPTQIKLSSWTRKMCQELGGGMVAVDKTDLKKFPNLFDATKLMRIYATSADNTTNMSTPLDKIGPGWYTPGTADFRFEDCRAPGQDLDEDGFTSENDPDCQDIKRFGFVQVEDCYPDGIDNDGNGLVDCNETHCNNTPHCGGAFSWGANPNDHTAPRVTRHNVEKFNDGAFVMFDTDEPSNGSILFYKTDSACGTLNTTIVDNGDPFCNENVSTICSFDDFKMPHFAPIDNFQFNPYKLNYTLEQNTSYFYKMQNCDPSGNCALSGCLNFTTLSSCRNFTFRFAFEGDANNSMMSSLVFDFDWNADGNGTEWDILGRDMSMTGVRMNCTTGKYVNIRMRNPNENWSLLLKGAKILDAKTVNITGGMLGGNTSSGTFLGLDSDKWQDMFQNLGVEGVELTIPNPNLNCTNLTIKNCNDNGQNCTVVTGSTDKACNDTAITIKIPVSLGFTTYTAEGAGVTGDGENVTQGVINLTWGWSLISMPLDNATDAETFISGTNCTILSKYDGGIQTHIKGSSFFNFNVTTGLGYFTYCATNDTKAISGSNVSGTVMLDAGWNLIGSVPSGITTAGALKTNISATDCLAVARYTGTGFETWDGNGTNFLVKSGEGYFAYMQQGGNWSIG